MSVAVFVECRRKGCRKRKRVEWRESGRAGLLVRLPEGWTVSSSLVNGFASAIADFWCSSRHFEEDRGIAR